MTEPVNDSASTGPDEASCVESLRRLVRGDYTAWYGLAGDCTRAAVTAALGESQGDVDLYGSEGPYRIYPSAPASPYGVYVWYVGDRPVALRMHTVTPTPPIEEQLGAPDAKDVSRMPGFKTQWIYASRGLTLHIDDVTGEVAWLYAYPPSTLDEYRSSWLSRVEIIRHRAE